MLRTWIPLVAVTKGFWASFARVAIQFFTLQVKPVFDAEIGTEHNLNIIGGGHCRYGDQPPVPVCF